MLNGRCVGKAFRFDCAGGSATAMGVPYQNNGENSQDSAGLAVSGPELDPSNYDGENEAFANIWTGYMSVTQPGYCECVPAAPVPVRVPVAP